MLGTFQPTGKSVLRALGNDLFVQQVIERYVKRMCANRRRSS